MSKSPDPSPVLPSEGGAYVIEKGTLTQVEAPTADPRSTETPAAEVSAPATVKGA